MGLVILLAPTRLKKGRLLLGAASFGQLLKGQEEFGPPASVAFWEVRGTFPGR